MARHRSRRGGRFLAACAALLVLSPVRAARADEPGLYLFHVPVTLGDAGAGRLGARIEARLSVSNPEYLAARLEETSVVVLGVDQATVLVAIGSDETMNGEPQTRHSAASFVVDFDEPPLVELVSRLQQAHGTLPSVDELAEFVDASIARKSYRRSFDLASQVARSREGDCTEHTVLLAALARATGRPARIVFGILFMESEGRVQAFGHAWAQIHDGDSWRIVDATFPQRQLAGATPRYLPLMELANEGPGYGLGMLGFAALQPARIDGVQTLADSTD